MPWSASDAKRHTKRANSPKRKRQWSAIANSALTRGASEGSAIRQANAVVGRASRYGLEMGGPVHLMPQEHPRSMGAKRRTA